MNNENGKNKINKKFKSKKLIFFSSFLLLIAFTINIKILVCKTILKRQAAIIWILLKPNNGFKIIPNSISM